MNLLTTMWLACFLAVSFVGQACARQPASPVATPGDTISVVATTDLHGHIESLPWLAGHLANLRAQRRAQGGDVLLVDAGDMFQGTLESNLGEGQVVVSAYNALGYAAAAIGNHEFDFGPVGPAHVPGPGQDPRGALKARAAQARFPFLASNISEGQGRARADLPWPNVRPWVMVTVAGNRIAVVGGTTEGTPRATHPRNFAGLSVRALVDTVTERAREARRAGAVAVVVVLHAGGNCQRLDVASDLQSCRSDEEVFQLARALPRGLVDVIAAGHTHQAVAHRVADIAIVQAYSEGRAFARVDLSLQGAPAARRLSGVRIFPPRGLCTGGDRPLPVPSFDPGACTPPDYEGRPVKFDRDLVKVLAPAVSQAAALRARSLGVRVESPVWRARLTESPLGNLAADLMLAASPGADIAFINGGSLRADLPVGPLSYGRLYQAFPFDDALSRLALSAGDLQRLLARNLQRSAGILSIAGLRADARCQGGRLQVTLRRPDGSVLAADAPLVAVTNGYLASGGDGLLGPDELSRARPAPGDEQQGPGSDSERPMRDLFAEQLAARPSLRGDDQSLFDPQNPRLRFAGNRPVRCGPGSGPPR